MERYLKTVEHRPSFRAATSRMLGAMRAAALLLSAAALAFLGACTDTRVPPTARAVALSDNGVREVKIVKLWNQSGDRIGENDPHISHYIEVDVLSGEGAGKPLTLPYDTWNVGKPPPAVGTVVVMAPADWVRRDPVSQGRPFGTP
jgi:hypothetical protein